MCDHSCGILKPHHNGKLFNTSIAAGNVLFNCWAWSLWDLVKCSRVPTLFWSAVLVYSSNTFINDGFGAVIMWHVSALQPVSLFLRIFRPADVQVFGSQRYDPRMDRAVAGTHHVCDGCASSCSPPILWIIRCWLCLWFNVGVFDVPWPSRYWLNVC